MPRPEEFVDTDVTQTALFSPDAIPHPQNMQLGLNGLDDTSDVIVSPEFLDSVRRLGVLEPVILREANARSWEIHAGKRRVQAARLSGHVVIPCRVYPSDTPDRVMAAITLSENFQRSPHAESELEAIETLINTGATIPQIAHQLGIRESVVINRLRIGNLTPDLRQLLQAGRMSITLAQRLGAESLQTQRRIATSFLREFPEPHERLTSTIAYPNTPQENAQMEAEIFPQPPRTDPVLDVAQREQIINDYFRSIISNEGVQELIGKIPDDRTNHWSARLATLQMLMRERPEDTRNHVLSEIGTTADQILVFLRQIPRQTHDALARHYSGIWQNNLIERIRSNPHGFWNFLSGDAQNALRPIATEGYVPQRGPTWGNEAAADRARAAERPRPRSILDVAPEIPRDQLSNAPANPGDRPTRPYPPGPNDDPEEQGTALPIVARDEAGNVEESWETVVEHLTIAADALPLEVSDACDQFHVDIEGLVVRAQEQLRLEQHRPAVGAVIPPPAPAEANANRVRAPRPILTPREAVGAAGMSEQQRLLDEQAAQINANTARRTRTRGGTAAPAGDPTVREINALRLQHPRRSNENEQEYAIRILGMMRDRVRSAGRRPPRI